MRRTLKWKLLFLALMCVAAQGAWAQTSWEEALALTQTTNDNWTFLYDSHMGGVTFGKAGKTTYYRVSRNCLFRRDNSDGSGLTIRGTVYLYVPAGVTITCKGTDATGATGAGAGIELTEGNTLVLLGGGTINATGGNAANGGNGSNGDDAFLDPDETILGGSGGSGGHGGGGAGAGIGTRGGNGGSGGAGGQRTGSSGDEKTQYGVDGNPGSAGSTAGRMGTLYVVPSSVTLNATAGSAGSNGTGGSAGKTAAEHPSSNVYLASGGGGGGAGGFGGAASNIGTGGQGGGGGGGGAAGNVAWSTYTGTLNPYYHAGAKGGSGGQNANGSYAPNGANIELTNPCYADYKYALRSSASDYSDDGGWESGNAWHDGGSGAACGSPSTNGSAINLVLWPTQGAGTAENPYLINNANDWNAFAINVSSGHGYSGLYVQLTADITVTTMAGSYQSDENYQPFSGTFDGDGHTLTLNVSNQSRFAAPFKCVSGATIKNLRSAGTIDGTGNADGKLLSGLVGVSFGNNTITGCVSSVTLRTDYSNDAAMAGFVAGTKGGSLTISGCAFDGSMEGGANSGRCAGIAGYEYTGTTTTISNSLFAPASLTVPTAIDGYTMTFTRDADATITNCYYTQTLGTTQGTKVYFTTASAPASIGALLEDYGMVKAYANGLFFSGRYYAASNADGGTQWAPYIIDSEAALALIARKVNSGETDYCDKYFSLVCDLDLSGLNWTPIGTTGHPFRGNFNGNNHTISNMTVNNPYGDYNGLFGWVEGKIINLWSDPTTPGSNYIKNFVVKNANVHGRNYTGGIAGRVHGELTFENVILDNGTVSGDDYTSGFIGSAEGHYWEVGVDNRTSWLHVNNCLFVNGSVSENTSQHDELILHDNRTSFVMFGNIERHNKLNNCYFANIFDKNAAAQGDYYNVQAYPVASDVPSSVSCNIYNTTGLSYGGSHYAPNNTTAHFTVACHDIKQVITGVSVNGSRVGTSAGNYDFTIDGSQAQAYTITVTLAASGSGDSEENPYLITNADEWNSFAADVNSGNNYSGKFVKLNANISVSTMAGTDDANSFQGTFDGDGKTLTFTKGTSGSPFDENYCAPFRHVKNAVIKNLHTTGTITTSAMNGAGLVGESHGALTIKNCRSSVAIDAIKSGDGTHGGFVATLSGKDNTIIIDGCIFDGSFTSTTGTTGCGGFVGWPVYNKPVIRNSLMIPGNVAAGMLGGTFARWHNGYEPTIEGCYFIDTDNLPADQGTKAITLASAPGNLGDLVKDYGMLKAYQNGLFFDGKYYVNADLGLSDNTDNGSAISQYNGATVDVTLTGCTFYKDGKWNTVCLPFNLILAGSPLDGAVARPLTGASISGSTLNLTFGDAVTELKAGTPYIIKWASGDNIVNPKFKDVTIDATDRSFDNGAKGDERVRFIGVYKSIAFDGEDKSVLLLGGANTLYHPVSGAGVGALRAYFKIGDSATKATISVKGSVLMVNGE